MKENMEITVDMLVSVYTDLTKKLANTRFKAFASHLRNHELTLNQYSILSYIERENACSSIQLAQHLNLKAASITYLVDALEKKGLVKRVNNPEDRRSQRIQLTEDGTSIASYSVDNSFAITFFEDMDQDDREILYLMARIMNKRFKEPT
ncbi:MarR family transcriptional regulator [Peribacillus psychrosaccharolyticus]|uniref:MarR family transcriptional regulator n=1 Tax=Peribacillus psychrosaccharolyticus TaxID=1407 RepID=A0A974NM45_PERPY|nr:MarR family transcriptional regulator [Peribacillus psychrosaccharolyticus]MEC2056399.1 MarR family transcriptional regulator [Peribacillus psychrosaccharolyticus]MED3743801.1 MarR family transcriptional regulator [Peribacillus psychrosaccharolyticus]QQT00441.1 MarR family transcriptional regulator [Peribacillus psychrosaccharolyticus]